MRQSIDHKPQINTAIPATIAKDGIPIFSAAPVAVAGAALELDVPARLDEREADGFFVEAGVIVEFDPALPVADIEVAPLAAPTSTSPVDAALTTCPFTVAADPPCDNVVPPTAIAFVPGREEAVIVTLPAART